MVDCYRSNLVNVVLEVPQRSVLFSLLLFQYTSKLLSIRENKHNGYADGFTLMAVVPSTGVRDTEESP